MGDLDAGWANTLSAGETDSSFDYAFFTLRIELTDAGQGISFRKFLHS